MKSHLCSVGILGLFLVVLPLESVTAQTNAIPAWLLQPLSMAESLDLALQHNATILRAKADLEASYGLVVQTRAIALPKLRTSGSYQKTQESGVETFPKVPSTLISPFPTVRGDQRWAADVRLVQSVYEGGRILSALRSARLTKEQALLQYQSTIQDTLLAVRIAYNDILLAEQQIVVQEASVQLLTTELADQQRRFEAGTVPRFNVLRAEVELANERPRLIRAKNAYRIGKNNLANLLGYNLPKEVWEDLPLKLSDPLQAEPFAPELPMAIAEALAGRTELASLRKAVRLTEEGVVAARALRKPSVQIFTGYGSRNSIFSDDLTDDVSGWFAGAQLSWDIFDGFYTKGRIQEAKARQRRAEIDLEDAARQVELEVRTAYSNFIEARELLESQKKVQEQADEALRLARVRAEAGTGTQLDVLNAQTALTQARTTQIEALRDYAVAKARLQRAIGLDLKQESGPTGTSPSP